ncbi:hypothetical protein BH09PSE3_BH09PSE3_14250 [soil metagenome]
MLVLFLALSVATAPGLAVLQEADGRVAEIAWALQTRNAPLCANPVPLAGFSVQTLAQYHPAIRATIASQTGIGSRPAVQAVVSGGAADRAGLRAGDTLIRIDGIPTPKDTAVRASYDASARTQSMIEAGLRKPPLSLRILRGRRAKTIAITGVAGCASRVEIVTGDSLNAQADGDYVQLSGSLVEFAANDDELATIIAHELAHNILGHRLRPSVDNVSHGVFARFGKSGATLRKAEFDADRLGVWLLARAGYDVDAVVPFWTRLGQSSESAGVKSDGTHPDWTDRIDRVATAIAQVKAQRTAGGPLIPFDLPTSFPAQQSSSQAQFPR